MTIEAVLKVKGHAVVSVQPWTPVAAAVHRLVGPPRIGALVVTGVKRGFTGVVSERAIIAALHRLGTAALTLQVREVMATHVPACAPTDSIGAAMATMTSTRHRHLPVLDQGELVGIVSIGDLVAARLSDMQLEANVLRDLYRASHSAS